MSKDVKFNIHLSVDGKDMVVNAKSSVKELSEAVGAIRGEAKKSTETLLRFNQSVQAIHNVYGGFQQLSGAMQPFIAKANAAAEAQTKLTTVMRQRMGATQADMAAINQLVTAQTKLGVVGGTVQKSGLQQLATFASQRSTLMTLLPAMNNLLVQQKGLSATSEDAAGIANLMGKALMGQASALRRVGVTLTPAQEQMIKYGNESQKAAALAEAITDNVGNMNREMAKTDAGHVKQIANTFGGLQVKVGQFLSQYQNMIAAVGNAGMAVTGIVSIGTAMRGLISVTALSSAAHRVWIATTGAVGTMAVACRNFQVELAVAEQLEGKSALAAAVSTTAFKTALRGLMAATVIGGVIALLTSGVEKLLNVLDGSGSSTDKAAAGLKKVGSAATETSSALDDQRSATLAPLITKYKELQAKWEKLTSDKQRLTFISDQSESFHTLGVKISGVSDAEDFLVKSTGKVQEALYARAEAAAAAAVAAQDMQKALQVESQANKAGNKAVLDKFDLQHIRLGLNGGKAGLSAEDKKKRAELERGLANGSKVAHTPWVDQQRARAKALREEAKKMLTLQQQDETKAQKALSKWQKRQYHAGGMAAARQQRTGHGSKGGSVGQGDTLTANPNSVQDWENNAKYYTNALEKCNVGDTKRIESLRKLRDQAQKTADDLKFENEYGRLESFDPNKGEKVNPHETADGYLKTLHEELNKANGDVENAPTIEAMVKAEAKRDKIQAEIDAATKGEVTIKAEVEPERIAKGSLADKRQSYSNAQQRASRIQSDLDAGIIDTGEAQRQIDGINKELQGLDKNFKPIKITVDTSDVDKKKAKMEAATDSVGQMGAALGQLGESIGVPDLNVAGTMAQAIATMVAGYATATSESASLGPWAWIAFAATGLAQLAAMISSVKGLAGSYATGGVVGGNSYFGDRLTAHVNSGEMILNRQQQARLFALANGLYMPREMMRPRVNLAGLGQIGSPGVQVTVDGKLKGRDIVLAASNVRKVDAKTGKRWG